MNKHVVAGVDNVGLKKTSNTSRRPTCNFAVVDNIAGRNDLF